MPDTPTDTPEDPELNTPKLGTTDTVAPAPLSRRDFLRRAGRETIETGGRIVPGAGVAKAVLGNQDKPGLLQKFAQWRTKRAEHPENESSGPTPKA